MLLRFAVLAAACSFPIASSAATITVSDPTNPSLTVYLRNILGPNNVGFVPGDRVLYGVANVEITPSYDGVPPTTATLTQGTTTEFIAGNDAGGPPFWLGGREFVDADPASWTVTLQNEGDTVTLTTPSLSAVTIPQTVTDLKVQFETGDPTRPTLSWTNPWTPGAADAPDVLRVDIFDLSQRNSDGFARNFAEIDLDPNATSFTFDPAVAGFALDPDTPYSFAIISDKNHGDQVLDAGTIYERNAAGTSAVRNRVFVDFTTAAFTGLADPTVPVNLPTVDGSGEVPVFNFNADVVGGEVEFFDPFIAIGYDFLRGDGETDSNFASFLLPILGDNSYELLLWNDATSTFEFVLNVVGGTEYSFINDLQLPGGVDRFRILGVDDDLQLDPTDATAFVTGLSFVQSGTFTGTMTPIVAPIPLPTSLPLMFAGIGLFAVMRRKRAAA